MNCPASGGTRISMDKRATKITNCRWPNHDSGCSFSSFTAWAEPCKPQELRFNRIAPGEMPGRARIRFLRHQTSSNPRFTPTYRSLPSHSSWPLNYSPHALLQEHYISLQHAHHHFSHVRRRVSVLDRPKAIKTVTFPSFQKWEIPILGR